MTKSVVSIADICSSWSSKEIIFDTKSKWPLFNPSIYVNQGNVIGIVRSSNYRMVSHSIYPITDDPSEPYTGFLRTNNYFVRLSDNLDLIGEPLKLTLSPTFSERSWRDHLEDLRLFTIEDEMYAVASLYERNGDKNSIKLIKFDGNGTISSAINIVSPFGRQKEKNWMPIVKGRVLCLVYLCSPTIVMDVNIYENTMAIRHTGDGPPELRGWSGSSQGCTIGNWTLCVVHKRIVDGHGLSYPHRFVIFDEEQRICALSDQFFFDHVGIEFCAGLARRGDRLIISYGVNDSKAMIGSMSMYDALNSVIWREPV